MNQTMTQWDAFLQAICENPEDDSVRLIAADWLEENAWRVAADGKARKGTTSAGDEAEVQGESTVLARAEFIRCQIEIERRRRGPAGPVPEDSPWLQADHHYHALRRRERELWNTSTNHRPQCWFEIPGWAVACPVDKLEVEYHPPTGSPFVCQVRRGFVSSVSLTCDDFAGGACLLCYGTSGQRSCTRCNDTGRTPGHAGALFRAAPIEKVTLTDGPEPVGPITGGPDQGKWFFSRRDVPDWLWPRFFDNGVTDHMITTHSVPTREDALRQRSAACVRYARAAAKGGT